MAGPIVNTYPIPSGGAIRLEMPEYVDPPSGVTTMLVSIAVSGASGLGAFTQVYSGALLPQFLDVGDIYPQPLDPTTQYVYQVADNRGSTQTLPVVPSWEIETVPDQLTQILIRLVQGAVNSMPLPIGINKTTVTTQMPQNGWQAMPFIIINTDLIQQTETAIGADAPVENRGDNNWTLFCNAKRVWRISILSVDGNERDFYRDTLLAALRVIRATAFAPLGFDVSHSVQAASYTDANEYMGQAPGFYGSDIMYEIDGVFPVTVLTAYGPIATIANTANIIPPPGSATITADAT